MAGYSTSTSALARKIGLHGGRREDFVGFKRKVLKSLFTNHGLHEIYLNASGLMMVRRQNGTGEFGRGYDAVDMAHAIELAKSGAVAEADAKAEALPN